MIPNFSAFADYVADSFQKITKGNAVFVTRIDGDDLYAAYLGAFSEGTNPIFKKRTEHDCSCCRGFIRRVGSVVAVAPDGRILTIWDEAAKKAAHPYATVAAAMRAAVLSRPISGLFRVSTKEGSFGAEQTRSQDPLSREVYTWEHFYTGAIPASLRVASPGQVCGDFGVTVAVFKRGLTELSADAIETVLSLIETGSLYRGEEHKPALLAFQKSQQAFLALNEKDRDTFAWAHAGDPAARFRNTVIGTLVTDLSSDVALEVAVRSFENKVAPQNYKRTTALVTPMMVKKAMETIQSLDLESALERRLAVNSDVSVNDVLWVNSDTEPLMKGSIGDVLMSHAKKSVEAVFDEKSCTDISLADFMSSVLPGATEIEAFFKNEHLGNLMVLTAPVHAEPKQLFRWNNDFAWSYGGNVADSIKERVKKAGGKVEGAVLRVSLSWSNYDDLDIHVYEPEGRGTNSLYDHIHFANRRGASGGVLDVDMNAGGARSREPVENVVWANTMPNGAYRVVVHQYNQRETGDVGFTVEVENGGKLTHYTYNKAVRQKQEVHVCTLHMKGGAVERVEAGDPGISTAPIKQTKWGLSTEQFAKVTMVTNSPNYWGSDAIGNKHTFFVLDGCACDEEMRGIYNEFLHPRLEGHRKVFELIGDKTKCAITASHLAGLGFSSTKRDTLVVRVRTGKARRTYTIKIG